MLGFRFLISSAVAIVFVINLSLVDHCHSSSPCMSIATLTRSAQLFAPEGCPVLRCCYPAEILFQVW